MVLSLLKMLNSDKEFVFQTFDDSPEKRQHLARTMRGTLSELKNELNKLNEQGAGIYITINDSQGANRKKEDITAARALWIDQDKDDVKLPGLAPSIVVETSPGKHHYYWIIKEPVKDLDAWDKVELSLVKESNGDISVRDRSRVLRCPGFYHMKDPNNPFLVTEVSGGSGKRYSWDILSKEFSSKAIGKTGVEPGGSKLDTAVANIISGSNYNDSLGTLSQHMANKQYSGYYIELLLKGLMLQSANQDKRWHARMNHLPKQIETALEKAKEFEFKPRPKGALQSLGVISTEFPIPPGRTGEIVENIMEFMKFPNKEIACVAALHTISTFAGRRFSFRGKGLTSRRILLAPQGTGKNTPTKYIQSVVKALQLPPDGSNMPRLIDANKFVISGDFTAVRPIHQELEEFATRSMILSEAGQAGMSDAGDKSGLKGYLLQLLSMSTDEFILPKKYSHKKTETGLLPVYNPCAVILHESVASNYAEVLRAGNEFTDGSMARSDLIYVDKPRDIASKNRNFYKAQVKSGILDFLAMLAHTCVKNIPEEGTIPLSPEHIIYAEYEDDALEDEMDDLDDTITERLNQSTNEIETALTVRRIERFYITCLILAIADTDFDVEHPKVIVTREHVNWVNTYQDALEVTVKSLGESGDLADPSEAAIKSIVGAIERVLSKPGKTYFAQNTTEMLKYQTMTRNTLSTFLSHNKAVEKYAKNVCFGNRIRAMNDLLKEMEAQGIIKIHPKATGRNDMYRPDYLQSTTSEVIQYLFKID